MRKYISLLMCVLSVFTVRSAHINGDAASVTEPPSLVQTVSYDTVIMEAERIPEITAEPSRYDGIEYGGQTAATGRDSEPDAVPLPDTEPPLPFQSGEIDREKPMIALSFDDGPSGHTSRVLDTLERHGARATFFTVGKLLEDWRETVVRAAGLGCEIAGHSWDHKDLTSLSEERIKQQILDTSSAIEAITGVGTRIFRPPYGAVNSRVKKVSGEVDAAMIFWSVDPRDWQVRDADAVYRAVMESVQDRDIIILHDTYGTTADAAERLIPELIDQGYQLVTVSELMSYAHESLEAGTIYRNGR